MQSKLIILYPAGFEEEITVKQVSSEEIKLPKSHGNKLLYTGVPPRVRGRIRKKQIYYTHFGSPFTFDPYNGSIFTDNKKRAILIERNIAYPLQFGKRNIAIILDSNFTDKPVPLWREETKDKYKDKTFDSLKDLQEWIDTNKDSIDDMELVELPVYTEYDVSAIDMMRAENFQLTESNAVQKTIIAMEKIGEERSLIWYFAIFATTVILSIGLFLYFAEQGVFR
jgi:hypothetical protein